MDGDSIYSHVMASLTGNVTDPSQLTYTTIAPTLYVVMQSDYVNQYGGFALHYEAG
jgi:hypothetical protein